MRVAALVIAPALLAVLFSISTTGVLPRPALDPLFDGAAAVDLATRFSTENPDRVPGTTGAENATRWYRETIAGLGLVTEEDVWTEDLPELGNVELRNVVTVIPGRSAEAVVLVAHRDNAGVGSPVGDNAAATAALIELGRGFAPQETAPTALPERTLVLVSTDAGAYGGAGARRFARMSPYAESAIAAVVLEGFDRTGRPRVAIAGDRPVSPARTLVRTAAARVEEQTGRRPELASVLTQLVDLGIPYAAEEQGPLLDVGLSAVTIAANGPHSTEDPGRAAVAVGGLGRATEALVSSIDASVGSAFRTPDSLFFDERAASGWAVRLTLVVAVVPFVLGVVDLVARSRRRRLAFRSALRGLRARLLFWVYCALLLGLGALMGVFPTGAALALSPHSPPVTDRPVAGLVLLFTAAVLGWLTARRRLVSARSPAPEEQLAGYVVGLAWMALIAVGLALLEPYALVFVLPSLYAWLWLPASDRPWSRGLLYVVGLLGPLVGLAILANELDLGLFDALLYVLSLVTVGYVSLVSVLFAIAWLAAASQLAALVAGRYRPYADGAAQPPPGLVRTSLARASRYARAR
ncbi:MAG TPA: M28 family peptidase [Gaiellaceae bacterium]|nr:M28 family peptidase [Gaiellaceae bacterium]